MLSHENVLPEYQTSYFETIRNSILSWTIPVNLVMAISDRMGGDSVTEFGIFKIFMDELKDNLNAVGGSSDFIAALIPAYLNEALRDQMRTGDMLAFKNHVEHDLKKAYQQNISVSEQNFYKSRALQTIMFKLGPHGLKYVQSLRAKSPNSWVANTIATAQNNLPHVPVAVVEALLKDAFKKQGETYFVEHFHEHFTIHKVSAGTVGLAAFVEFSDPHSKKKRELVVKILRPGVIDLFIKDNQRIKRALEKLVLAKKVTDSEAKSFMRLSDDKLESEKRETNPNLENAQLLKGLYTSAHIKTVDGVLDLFSKTQNVVFMEKAEGIPLNKYLQDMRKIISSSTLPPSEKNAYLKQLFLLRKTYSELFRLHICHINQNKPVHADLHDGNLFYDHASEKLSVLDLGAVARTQSPAEHLNLRRFLFSLQLTAATADIEYLRLFYEDYQPHPDVCDKKVDPVKIADLLKQISIVLEDNKKVAKSLKTLDVDKITNDIMGIFEKVILNDNYDIIPTALMNLGRSNQLLADGLNELKKDLEGSLYEAAIPYLERTQFGIAIHAAKMDKESKHSELWTKKSLLYFIKHHLTLQSEFQFEKKFIYGMLGLSDTEATLANILFPVACISSPFLFFKSAKLVKHSVKTAANRIPELIESYQIVDTFKKANVPMHEFHHKMHTFI
ncbi:MAG TPA: AarF/UbiB family protein, partial [Gammaproteobacteria bacterium]|nr:AarF/UbiB family protein [Gammaproteobacteria bacterium]